MRRETVASTRSRYTKLQGVRIRLGLIVYRDALETSWSCLMILETGFGSG